MKTLTIREARAALGHLDELLAKEGEILVTRRGKPVARFLPMPGPGGVVDHKALRASMPYQKVPSEVLLREERGRR